jgi:hypothetical protein
MNPSWIQEDGTVNYREYIHSVEWMHRRRKYLRTHPVCSRCAMTMEQHHEKFGLALSVHHLNYRRLGDELDSDLETICRQCHRDEHHEDFEPEYGDYLAVKLGTEQPAAQAQSVRSGRDFVEWDFLSPASEYWPEAQARIERQREKIKTVDNELAWRELERLAKLEDFVRACTPGNEEVAAVAVAVVREPGEDDVEEEYDF